MLDKTDISYDYCHTTARISFLSHYIGRDRGLRDLSIANYMQQIESVEMASFQILEMAAVKLKDKQVKKLLKESYNGARTDQTLLLLIATNYIMAK